MGGIEQTILDPASPKEQESRSEEERETERKPSLLRRCLEIQEKKAKNGTEPSRTPLDEHVDLINEDRMRRILKKKVVKNLKPHIASLRKKKIDAYQGYALGYKRLGDYVRHLRAKEQQTLEETINTVEKEIFHTLQKDPSLFTLAYTRPLSGLLPNLSQDARSYIGLTSYLGQVQFEHLFYSKQSGETKKAHQFYKRMLGTLSQTTPHHEGSTFSERIKKRITHARHNINHTIKYWFYRQIDKLTGPETYRVGRSGLEELRPSLEQLTPFSNKKVSDNLQRDISEAIINHAKAATPLYRKRRKKRSQRMKQIAFAAIAAGIMHFSIPYANEPRLFSAQETSASLREASLLQTEGSSSFFQSHSATDENQSFHTIPNIYWKTIDNKKTIDSFLEDHLMGEERLITYTDDEQDLLDMVNTYQPVFVDSDHELYDTAYYNPAVPTENVLDQINFMSQRDGTGITVTDDKGEVIYHIPNMHEYMEEIPDLFSEILMLVEDQQFHYHTGINPYRTAVAAQSYLSIQEDIQTNGNSTITQQLAKLLFFWDEEESSAQGTINRKVQEMIVAHQLEVSDSFFWMNKDKILHTYLNQVYGGGTPYGIEARGLASIFNVNYGYSTQEIIERYSSDEMSNLPSPEQGLRVREIAHFIASLKAPTRYIVNYRTFTQSLDTVIEQTAYESRDTLFAALLDGSFAVPETMREEDQRIYRTLFSSSLQQDYLRTKERIATVLAQVHQQELISEDILASALEAELQFETPPIINTFPSYHDAFCEELKTIAPDEETYHLLLNSNLTFRTHLDSDIQHELQERIDRTTAEWDDEITGGGIVIQLKNINQTPDDITDDQIMNAIVALVGNNSNRYIYNDITQSYQEGFSQMLDARRSIGSIAKLAVLAEAYDQHLTSASAYWDIPRIYTILHPRSDSSVMREQYIPDNYRSSFSYQPTTIQYALNQSMNSIFLKLASVLGVSEVTDMMNDLLQLDGPDRLSPILSNALGSQELSGLQVMNMITTIANSGTFKEPRIIDSIETRERRYSLPSSEERVLDEDVGYQLLYSTSQTVSRGTLSHHGLRGDDEGRYFGKTGTSQRFADAQSVMWTHQYAGYVRYNRPESNQPIPFRRTADGSVMIDWRGEPIRMTGSQEPTRDIRDVLAYIDETKEHATPHVLELMPESVKVERYRGREYPLAITRPQYFLTESLRNRPLMTITDESGETEEFVLEQVRYPE